MRLEEGNYEILRMEYGARTKRKKKKKKDGRLETRIVEDCMPSCLLFAALKK